ncbi:hypothetical protein Ancab_036731 [Ancistrocladus abbreviatus]
MGKKGGTSWLTAVKRAFRSPTKETDKVRNCRRKEDHDHEDEDDKKRDKRRWIFRKGTNIQESGTVVHQSPLPRVNHAANTSSEATGTINDIHGVATVASAAEQRHAIAVAVATAAAAEAAVATAQAAMEVARLTRPANNAREHYAAVVIQTAFRGYLARRALRALKGLVKLQALVRGHNVRKQAKMTLKCMQALVRVQARVLDQRMRLSHEGSRKSMTFSDTNSVFESRYLHEIAERRSISHSREPSSIADDWDQRPHTIEEVKAMLQSRKEAALKRERSLSHAFSQQMWRSDRSSMGGEDELEEKPKWLERWMMTRQWENRGRASTDHRDSIKTVEIDTSQPYSYLAPNFMRPNQQSQNQHQNQYQYPNHQRPASPLHRAAAHHNPSALHQQPPPVTPSPSRTRPIQVRSASPRCVREERTDHHSAQTPSLRSNYHYNGSLHPHYNRGSTSNGNGGGMPNYMAATESAKARLRSQSAPRQRASTPERDRGVGSAKKRLSFPVPADPCSTGNGYGSYGSYGHNNLRSPSFKSVNGLAMMEQHSNYSSCCTDSLGGEISPSSTTDLRRWLR